ncbi:MAG: hypothetical protein COA80_14945, partial [Leeuwenhoekiella sp.]
FGKNFKKGFLIDKKSMKKEEKKERLKEDKLLVEKNLQVLRVQQVEEQLWSVETSKKQKTFYSMPAKVNFQD